MPYSDKEKEREYQRQYHLKTWGQRKVKNLTLKRLRRAKLAEWLKTYKRGLACNHCSENHPACLDFHHQNGLEKNGTIANMISEGYSIKNIMAEINKCIVLCRNCHAKVHFKEYKSSTFVAPPRPDDL